MQWRGLHPRGSCPKPSTALPPRAGSPAIVREGASGPVAALCRTVGGRVPEPRLRALPGRRAAAAAGSHRGGYAAQWHRSTAAGAPTPDTCDVTGECASSTPATNPPHPREILAGHSGSASVVETTLPPALPWPADLRPDNGPSGYAVLLPARAMALRRPTAWILPPLIPYFAATMPWVTLQCPAL